MKYYLFSIIALFWICTTVYSQELFEINTYNRCIHEGNYIESELFKFPLTATVPSIVDRILIATGKSKNFELIETNVENVVSVVSGDRRYILYSPEFIHRLKNKWETYSIIAHAIGHHVNFHLLETGSDSGSPNETEELEADYFVGYALALLGMNLNELENLPFYQRYKDRPPVKQIETKIPLSTVSRYTILGGFKKANDRLNLNQSLEYFKDNNGNFKPPIPQFDWPPPKPSTSFVIEDSFGDCINLAAVDKKLREALQDNEYDDKSYFYVPRGFALVTRLEQINRDATSKAEPYRWQVKASQGEIFTLRDYLRALFTAPKGYFRIIVFVVTDESFSTSGGNISRAEALDWLSEGANVLPKELGRQAFNNDYSVTTLVYEFETFGSGKSPVSLVPGKHTGRTHLEKSKLWYSLNK